MVSIIMPAYNAAHYIAEAIRSVLCQSYSDFELLIINDGSEDKTESIIRSFKDTRIRYFHQENHGVATARNVGLKAMQGEYFCFVDADDLLPPNSLIDRLAIFENDSSVEFVDGKVEVFNNNTHQIERIYNPTFQGNPFYELLSLSENCFFGITWMIKRMENKVYQFKEGLSHGEDLLFYLSITGTGNYRAVTNTIYKCRSRKDSAMSNLSKLETGYFFILEEISQWPSITEEHYGMFKKKIKSIIFKSYLGSGKLLNAIRVLTR